MLKKSDIIWIAIMVAALIAAGGGSGAQKISRKPSEEIAPGGTNGNASGKISKQEFMKRISEEFDRLDVNKKGELDLNDLKHSGMRASLIAAAR